MSDDELKHYGVMGMKWGVRNAETRARYSREGRVVARKALKIAKKSSKADVNFAKADLRREKMKRSRGYAKSGYKAAKYKYRAAKAATKGSISKAAKYSGKAFKVEAKYAGKSGKIAKLEAKGHRQVYSSEKRARKLVKKYDSTTLAEANSILEGLGASTKNPRYNDAVKRIKAYEKKALSEIEKSG